ncbi:hypothetical protein QA641_32330 [Bradyrhizobium sp. CB1650]|uniref:hypothetical protein n=1 Tax=Bradyrhizobium sp. CB1650 TaxID=3039153 RepID=UPI002434B3D0|nr:hypothetical protein [Bradyrhizobium sp. CB1650]WGD50262.1 hypothetical protein QA641_32330 [Bradyrhizobium sp. CB1650]
MLRKPDQGSWKPAEGSCDADHRAAEPHGDGDALVIILNRDRRLGVLAEHDQGSRSRRGATVREFIAVDQGRVARQQKAQEAPHWLHQIEMMHLDDVDGVGLQQRGQRVPGGLECPTEEDGKRGDVGSTCGGGLGVMRQIALEGVLAIIVLLRDGQGSCESRKPRAASGAVEKHLA